MAAQAAEEDVLAIASVDRVASEDDHEGAGWSRSLCLERTKISLRLVVENILVSVEEI